MKSIDKKIETLMEAAESNSAFCRILIGFSITISLIIIGVLTIQLTGFEAIDFELFTTALVSACIGLMIGLTISSFLKK
jgi:hypothetical protein